MHILIGWALPSERMHVDIDLHLDLPPSALIKTAQIDSTSWLENYAINTQWPLWDVNVFEHKGWHHGEKRREETALYKIVFDEKLRQTCCLFPAFDQEHTKGMFTCSEFIQWNWNQSNSRFQLHCTLNKVIQSWYACTCTELFIGIMHFDMCGVV